MNHRKQGRDHAGKLGQELVQLAKMTAERFWAHRYINYHIKNWRLDKMSNDNVSIFKEIMGSYPTGVTILTTTDAEEKPCGLTVNSFASVSLDPNLVLWCIDRRSASLEAFEQSQGFVVHILAADQEELCWAFAGKDPDRFSKADWSLSKNNLPVISGSLGVLECKTVQQIDAGDHIIFLGEIIDIDKQDKEPMLYFRRDVGKIPTSWPAVVVH
ncbi:FMN reductase (NADH) RutF (plasmid) [Peribacillus frigoritolerans]